MDYWIEFLMTTALGIISYFLKKTMDKIDRTEREVQRIERDFVTETAHAKDMEDMGRYITKIREDYTPRNEFKDAVHEFRNDLKTAQKEFLTKEDFIRENRKTEQRLDDIYKLLLKERS